MENNKIKATIYKHYDGDPHTIFQDFQNFFNASKTLKDSRFNDPNYLAARYVVWLANQFSETSPIDFLGVGICITQPYGIQYQYFIDCSTAFTPIIEYKELY